MNILNTLSGAWRMRCMNFKNPVTGVNVDWAVRRSILSTCVDLGADRQWRTQPIYALKHGKSSTKPILRGPSGSSCLNAKYLILQILHQFYHRSEHHDGCDAHRSSSDISLNSASRVFFGVYLAVRLRRIF